MKKLLLTLSLPLFLFNQTKAQSLGHVTIVSAPPCATPGLSGTIVITPIPGVDFYHWFTVPAQVFVLLNGTLPPYETASNSVILSYVGSTPSYSLCVYGYNSCCFTDTTCINYPCTTGIESAISNPQSAITISPNPFTDKITITNKNNEAGEIILYDIAGRIVAQASLSAKAETVEVPIGDLGAGMYLYEVRNKSGVMKKGKIIKS